MRNYGNQGHRIPGLINDHTLDREGGTPHWDPYLGRLPLTDHDAQIRVQVLGGKEKADLPDSGPEISFFESPCIKWKMLNKPKPIARRSISRRMMIGRFMGTS